MAVLAMRVYAWNAFMHTSFYLVRTCGAAVRRVVLWAAMSVDVMKYETIVAAICQNQCGCIQECASVKMQFRCLLDNKYAGVCEQAALHFPQQQNLLSPQTLEFQVRARLSQSCGYYT